MHPSHSRTLLARTSDLTNRSISSLFLTMLATWLIRWQRWFASWSSVLHDPHILMTGDPELFHETCTTEMVNLENNILTCWYYLQFVECDFVQRIVSKHV